MPPISGPDQGSGYDIKFIVGTFVLKAGTELSNTGNAAKTLGVLKSLIRPYLRPGEQKKLDKIQGELQEELEMYRSLDGESPVPANWQFPYLESLMDFARKARLLGWERPVIR